MNKVSVKSYTRKTKSGKTITIRAYERRGRGKKSAKGNEGAEFENKKAQQQSQADDKTAKYREGLKNLSAEDKAAWISFEKRRRAMIANGQPLRQGLKSTFASTPKKASAKDEVFTRLEAIQKRNNASAKSKGFVATFMENFRNNLNKSRKKS